MAMLLIALPFLMFTSCNKEEDSVPPIPTVNFHELGYDNSKEAIAGGELHMDAEIIAEGLIKDITVTIKGIDHPEHETSETFTRFNGQINLDFHEHIEIPEEFEEGHYSFRFNVGDENGFARAIDDEIEIHGAGDGDGPEIHIESVTPEDPALGMGEMIHIEGHLHSSHDITGLYIALVREDQGLANEDVNHDNTITLMHTHDFDNAQNFEFDVSIEVGAAVDNDDPPKIIADIVPWASGEYYLLVKAADDEGNVTFSSHQHIMLAL
jgi:hypothetical protein